MNSVTQTESTQRDPALLIGWVAMVMGMFMAILDIQIVASSLSDIQAGLAASADEISWVQTAYLVAEVIMIPLSGFLARLLSTRRLFLICAAGFTLSSAACALAWSLESLVFFRMVQGFIGGGMIPSVFASIYIVFPREKQPIANVVVGLIVTIAPAVGPTLGGYITELLSWHWLFLINLTPGLIVISLVSSMPDFDRGNPNLKRGFDLIGLLLMALFLGGLEFVLDEGPRKDWFDDGHITFWATVSAMAAYCFFWRVLTYDKPIVDLSVFANRNFWVGCLLAFILGIGLFGSVYSVPLFLARVQNFSALQIGEVMSIGGLFMLLTAPLAGRLAGLLDLRILLFIGLILAGLGLYMNGHLNHDSKFHELFWPQALRGMGLMCMIVTANTLALGLLPPDKINNGSGLYNLSRNMGGAIGLAAINTMLDSRQRFHLDHLSQWLNPARPEFQQFMERGGEWLSQQGVNDMASLGLAAQTAHREALIMAFNDVHIMMASAFLIGILLIPLIRKPRASSAPAH